MTAGSDRTPPGATPAEAHQTTRVNCALDHHALQAAIAAAAEGDTLRITGTCYGPFTIDKDLTLRARATPSSTASARAPP